MQFSGTKSIFFRPKSCISRTNTLPLQPSEQEKKRMTCCREIRMLHYSARHNLSTIILLMVMVLQVGIKTFHVHSDHVPVHIECEDCDQHRVHDGHLTDWDGQSDECVLCQLLSVQYVAAATYSPDAIEEQRCLPAPDVQPMVCQGQWQNAQQRGPPSYLLF